MASTTYYPFDALSQRRWGSGLVGLLGLLLRHHTGDLVAPIAATSAP